jgi:hypothetical protein
MDSFSSLGVNRSDTRRYREDLQRQLGNEDTILCKRFSETKYQTATAFEMQPRLPSPQATGPQTVAFLLTKLQGCAF